MSVRAASACVVSALALSACEPKLAAAPSDASAPLDGAPGASAKPSYKPFVPVEGATAGSAFVLSRGALLQIDSSGRRTNVKIQGSHVLDVETMSDGKTYVLESTGLLLFAGKALKKVHAFGDRMKEDVEAGAVFLPGPNGEIAVLGAKRIWVGNKSGWKGGGRTTAAQVVRDRWNDLDIEGTPIFFSIDADDGELRFLQGDTWQPGPSLGMLAFHQRVLAVAPAFKGGFYAVTEHTVYRAAPKTEPVSLVDLETAPGASVAVSTSGVLAVRSTEGGVTVVSAAGETTRTAAVARKKEEEIGSVFAVDDLGRVWFIADGALRLFSPKGGFSKVARTGELADVVAIAVTGAGPPAAFLAK